MADDIQLSSRSDGKRKYEDQMASAAPPSARRATGFSTPIAPPSSDSHSAAAPPSYSSVPPPLDGFELAKQKAREIAARLLSDAEAKRPRLENGGSGADAGDGGFGSSTTDDSYLHKPLGQHIANSQVNMSTSASFATYGYPGTSKRIEIPNGKVGVIIGKGGETIKYLQLQSGAKIQVTRDADADPNSLTRTVELTGTSEQISRAEQLINDALQEAEVGGSGVVTARKYVGVQAGSEQLILKVPNNRVGMIIGKGGETIKSMQAKSGARIQIIPLHLPPGDTSTERNVHIDGTKEQVESAKQLVNEVISENRVRNQPVSGGYPQQSYRPPQAPTSWGPPGPPPMLQPGFGYTQPGTYPGPPSQYNLSQPPYAGYPPPPASGGYYGGWDQTSSTPGQQTTPNAGYDYYNQQQPQQQPLPVAGSSAPDGGAYNYSQPQSSTYSTQGSYNESAYSQPPVAQSQGYSQDAYSGGFHAPGAQTGYAHPQSNVPPVYDQQQNYGSAPAYGVASQDGSTATYGTQSGSVQVPPPQLPPVVQPPVTQQGLPAQQPSSTPTAYPQVTGHPGPEVPQASQPGYGGQPPVASYGHTASLTQPNYVQPPQDHKTPPAQPVYGQDQQPATTQSGYVQPVAVQPGFSHPPPAQSVYTQQDSARQSAPPPGFVSAGPPGYGQLQSYGGVPPQGQPGYGQQQQPYGDSYGSGSAGSYSQPPSHSSGQDAPTTQAGPGDITETSPQS